MTTKITMTNLSAILIFFGIVFTIAILVDRNSVTQTDRNNRYKRSTSASELQDIHDELRQLVTEMNDVKMNIKGIPVLLELAKRSNSSLCEQILDMSKFLSYFPDFGDQGISFLPKNELDLNEMRKQLGQWRKAFSLCDFSVNQTYGIDRFNILHFAAGLDDIDTVEMALNKGADIHEQDRNGHSPLHFAAFFNRTKIMEPLLRKGAHVNQPSVKGMTPLQSAVLGEAAEATEILVRYGADVNARDPGNYTALHYAVNVPRIMDLLLQHGADPNARSNKGETPLFASFWGPTLDVMKMLVGKGADINARNDEGKTLLHSILEQSVFLSLEKIQYLIDNGADLHVKTDRGETLLHLAAGSDDAIPIMKLLLEKGVDINATDVDGNSSLHFSSGFFGGRNTEFLVENGAHVDAQRKDGKTALHLAVKNVHAWSADESSMHWLLKKKANVNIQDNDGWTPLHVAVQENSLKGVKWLVEAGADTRLKTNEGKTAYQIEATYKTDDTDEIQALLDKYPH